MNIIREYYKDFQGEILSIPSRVIALVFGVFLLMLPFVVTGPFYHRIFIFAFIFAIYAASWDLLAGFVGQLNLGHGALFGVAAYAAGLINYHFHITPWLTIPLGAMIGLLSGLLIAIPTLRLRGVYFALVTLAYPMILLAIVFAFPKITGGELGIYGIKPLVASRLALYYITLGIMVISLLIMWKVTDTKSSFVKTGILFSAVREDEITARATGINTIHIKLLAFSISGFFAGIAGGLYCHFIRVVGPSSLELMFSLYPIMWTIFGGMGTIYGPAVGVFILYPFTEYLRIFTEAQSLILGIVVVIILLIMPEGISVWIIDKIEEICPRCKTVNIATRQHCRACGAQLKLDK